MRPGAHEIASSMVNPPGKMGLKWLFAALRAAGFFTSPSLRNEPFLFCAGKSGVESIWARVRHTILTSIPKCGGSSASLRFARNDTCFGEGWVETCFCLKLAALGEQRVPPLPLRRASRAQGPVGMTLFFFVQGNLGGGNRFGARVRHTILTSIPKCGGSSASLRSARNDTLFWCGIENRCPKMAALI